MKLYDEEDFEEAFKKSAYSAPGYLSNGEKVWLRNGFMLAGVQNELTKEPEVFGWHLEGQSYRPWCVEVPDFVYDESEADKIIAKFGGTKTALFAKESK